MKRLLLIAGVLALLFVVGAAAWFVWTVRPERVRAHLISAVSNRFASRVDVDSAMVSLYPRPTITGTGLRIQLRNADPALPPLVSVNSFEASAPFSGLVGPRVQLGNVTLGGTDVRIPPGGFKPAVASLDSDNPAKPRRAEPSSIVIDEIVSKDARLEIATRQPNKLPRVFEIHDLIMRGFGLPEGSRFQAGVTNAIPRGRVETTGIFGPWLSEEPTLTPIRGEYSFRNANLNDIKGIAGILSSVGQYRGTLERIEVDGQTETPDFSIDLANQPVPLFTRFKAIVDGTNGDTWLDRVDAKLGESNIVASGAVIRERDVKGRHVALDIQIRDARIEDVLRLAVKAAKAPMTGRMELTTTFLLPAGEQDVIDRLNLNGRFRLGQARFSNIDVQRRIEALSLRARGKEDAEPSESGPSVVSNMRGRFVMRGAKIDFKELTFTIPGAEVQLAGLYDLHSEALDFKGELLVDASLADMTSGFKSFLARLAQPFFRRPGGGSRFPIKISGPRSKPEFGLDMGRVFKRG
ncbi:MAG TPA: AsmA-like C-terminal region-containing protein [Vicinamibacterales bacterium]|nr:AsmA-like C-terminal region-containing protein [Vicinamibacterales bacterium]